IIAIAMKRLGIGVTPVGPEEGQKRGNVLCFLHQSPGDLLLHGRKVVGSAQRKSKGVLLQHGAILLGQSSHTPDLPGLHELAGFSGTDYDAVEKAVLAALETETNWHIEPTEWTSAEAERREELANTKYTRNTWNAKR